MEYYKITEYHDEYNRSEDEENPVWKTKIEREFKHKEDCLNHFFKPRKRRDFCSGDNYRHVTGKQGDKVLIIDEDDEGGVSTYILHKWEGFDDEVVFKYFVTIGEEELEMDYTELYKWLEEHNAYVYWQDDTYGHYGEAVKIPDPESEEKYIHIAYVKCEISGSVECKYY